VDQVFASALVWYCANQGLACLIAIVVALLYGRLLAAQGRPLKRVLGRGILTLEMPWTAIRAAHVVRRLSKADLLSTARLQVLLDFGFLLVYPVAIFSTYDLLTSQYAAQSAGTPSLIRGWLLPFGYGLAAAAVFDAIENVAMLYMLRSKKARRFWPKIASVCAAFKFLLVALGVLGCVAAFLSLLLVPNKIEHLYECNAHGGESRLIPAVVLCVILMSVWRFRSDAEPSRETSGLEWFTLVFSVTGVGLALGYGYDWLPAGTWRELPVLWLTCLALMSLWVAIATRRFASVPEETRSGWSKCLAPATCALGATAVIVLALLVSHFLEIVVDENLKASYLIVSAENEGALGQDFGARAHRAITMALTFISAMVAAWMTVGIWWECQSRDYALQVTKRVALMALTAAVALGVLGLAKLTPGLDSAFGNAMLCATWARNDAPWLAMVSDANNVLGIFIPVMVGLGMCLLLEPITHPWMPSRDELATLARNSRTLDHLLYVGAICLVFGILQMSAVYSSAVATLPTTQEVKTKVEICKSIAAITHEGKLHRELELINCHRLVDETEKAELADSFRQFARSTTLVFGIAFSVLLAALYVPAALLLSGAAQRLAKAIGSDGPKGGTDDVHGRLRELGIESDLLGKIGKVITTLSPIFAGLISNALGGFG
jgi:hypothetical protein